MMQELDQFLASVQRKALRIAELSLRNRDDALDVLQDAMLSFAKNYSEKPCEQWPPLFFKILYNRINDFHRARKTRMGVFTSLFSASQAGDEVEEDNLQAMADSGAADPSVLGDQDRFAARLESALRALPERQRQAFLLREWEGLSVADTAHVMECSEGSVKTHLSRAKSSLQEKLADF